MSSMLSTFFYFMVVVGSTVAMLRNLELNSSSTVRNLYEPRSAKETFIEDLLLKYIDDSADPCEDFHQYACGKGLSMGKTLIQDTVTLKNKNVMSIIKTHPAVFKYYFTCQLQFSFPINLPEYIKNTITKIETSKDVPSIMAILATLMRERDVRSIIPELGFSNILLKKKKFTSQVYFNLGFDLTLIEKNIRFKTILEDLIVKNKILSLPDVQQIPSIIKQESLLKKSGGYIEKVYEVQEIPHKSIGDLSNRYPNTIGHLLKNLFPGKNLNELLVHNEVNEDSFVVMDKFLTTASLSTVIKVLKYAIVYQVAAMQSNSKTTNSNTVETFCENETKGLFWDVINEEYKKRFIPPKTISVVKSITENVLNEAISTLYNEDSLLDPYTRKAFRKKVKAIKTQLGSHEVPQTKNKLQLKEKTYIAMKLELSGIRLCQQLDSVGTQHYPKYFFRTDYAINAEYETLQNEVTIFSGRFQSPLFQADYPSVMQYGLIGSAFAHEITHSIDPRSIRYDKQGLINDKWFLTQNSKDDFDLRVKCFRDFYSKMEVLNNEGKLVKNVDGHSTLQESIAESGVQLAYLAFLKTGDTESILDFTAAKLFYLSYAQNFCKSPPSNRVIDTITTHHFSKERVNGNLMLDTNFARAFQCSPTSTMNPQKKCSWWGNQ